MASGGRFDFDDGGTYCGEWEEAKAHGSGVCTGPDAKGEYAGVWHYGFEVSGVYTWPSGNTYEGQWQNGKRHGLAVENHGRWTYKGDWSHGLKGRYGLRQSTVSQANYLGTWSNGLHDGYGTETYVDGGTYSGQWLRGLRHGYGIRTSAPFGVAAKLRSRSQTNASMTSLRSNVDYEDTSKDKKDKKAEDNAEEFRGGFVLRVGSDAPSRRRRSLSERSLAVKRTILSNLRIKKQHSTGDIHQRVTSMTGSLKSSGSTVSFGSDDDNNHRNLNDFYLAAEERVDPSVVETYKGEWKNDKRSGFGICERTDNVKYAGEWFNNRKHGYGITFFKDGTKEEGRYKNNVLVCSTKRKGLLFVRSSRLRDRIESSVESAKRASDLADQRADITQSRTQTAQERANLAVDASERAKDDADTARIHAKQFDPNFKQPGIEHIRHARHRLGDSVYQNHVSFESSTSAHQVPIDHHSVHQPNHQYEHSPQSHSDLNYSSPHVYQPEYHHPNTAPYHPNQMSVPNRISYEPSHSVDHQDVHRPDTYQTPHQTLPQQNHVPHQQHVQPLQVPPQVPLQPNTVGVEASTENLLNPSQVSQQNLIGNHVNYGAQTSQVEAKPELVHRQKKGRAHTDHASTISLSDDHYDQYTLSRSSSQSQNIPQLRRNRPSLTRQTEVLAEGVHLNRRSTLASSRDRAAVPNRMSNAVGGPQWEHGGEEANAEDRGSLPNLDELAQHGVSLRREDAARLASQRRQEAQRLQEEEELLRANPLRYLYHPALRNWIYNNQGLLLLVGFNISLIYVLFYLLTYDRN